MGTSISSRHSQSGFEAEEERAATADSMWVEQLRGRPSIFPINSWEPVDEARKAAGA